MEIEQHLRETKLHDNEQPTDYITASIRINPKNFTDAFVSSNDGGPDIWIEGIQSRNVAMDGDIVRVKLNDCSKWKLNYIMIANRWDDWSSHLMPLIQDIENCEKVRRQEAASQNHVVGPDQDSGAESSSNGVDVRSARVKRSASTAISSSGAENGANDKVAIQASKLPSNLPPGIAKLGVQHIINLPFSAMCIRKTGFVVEVVKKNHLGVAGGTLRPYSSELALFSPTDSRVPRMLISLNECPIDFASLPDRYKDVLFVARVNEWQPNTKFALGNLVRLVGDRNDIHSIMEALLLENQIYDTDFPQDAHDELEYLKKLPDNWFAENSTNRRDLTDECVFTIDPKTARDLDDAVSIKQVAEQIYEVGVHIADVSYFVNEMSAVDYYARLRTTSVYLVDRVIPMLPRLLCEQMCSLNPNEPKLTFSVIWKMDKYGRIIDEWFGRTIIKSCAKLAYEQVQDLIDNPDDIAWIKEGVNMPTLYAYDWKHITKSAVLLNKIAQNMRARRFEGGALKIDQVKLKFELDPATGFPTGFAFEHRSAANFLIEEYMLLANMSVAKRIYQHSKEKSLLRRHPSSSAQILKEVKDFCDAKGCPLDISSSGSLQKSLNAIADPTMSKVVSFLLLRAMKNAEYICTGGLPQYDNSFSHFALNVPFYTHFTSPIRRYADVIVHRMLALSLGYMSESNEDLDSLTKIADECTKRKISSKKISDHSQKLYFNLYVLKAGFCELLACVTQIYDQSFDVIIIDYDRQGRVYIDKLKSHLDNFKFESFSGIKRLVLAWKPSPNVTEVTKKKNRRKKKKDKQAYSEDQLSSRANLESQKVFSDETDIRVNESINNRQIIEVFDVIRVIVTVDEKDITQLNISLKIPTS